MSMPDHSGLPTMVCVEFRSVVRILSPYKCPSAGAVTAGQGSADNQYSLAVR